MNTCGQSLSNSAKVNTVKMLYLGLKYKLAVLEYENEKLKEKKSKV